MPKGVHAGDHRSFAGESKRGIFCPAAINVKNAGVCDFPK
jgi:hypothetical protein